MSARVRELEAENVELKAENAELHARLEAARQQQEVLCHYGNLGWARVAELTAGDDSERGRPRVVPDHAEVFRHLTELIRADPDPNPRHSLARAKREAAANLGITVRRVEQIIAPVTSLLKTRRAK